MQLRLGRGIPLALFMAVAVWLARPSRPFGAEPDGGGTRTTPPAATGPTTPVSKRGGANKPAARPSDLGQTGKPAKTVEVGKGVEKRKSVEKGEMVETGKPPKTEPVVATDQKVSSTSGSAGTAANPVETNEQTQSNIYGCIDKVLCISGEGRLLKNSLVHKAGKQPVYVFPLAKAEFQSVSAQGAIVVSAEGQKVPPREDDKTGLAKPWAIVIDVPNEPKSGFTLQIDGRNRVQVALEYPLAAEEVALFEKQRCAEATVVCVDTRSKDGLFRGDRLPSLRGGDRLVAVAIGPTDTKDMKTDVKLSVSEMRSLELLVRPTPSSAQEQRKETGEAKPPTLEVKASLSAVIGDGEQARLTMEVTSHDLAKQSDSTSPPVVFTIIVLQGRYFLDIGIAAVCIARGSRQVEAAAIPGTGERVAHVNESTAVEGALMINAFVFGGRRVNGIWYKGDNESCCHSLFGAQIGFNLDLKNPLDQTYLGVFIEPIAGLSLAAGAALLKGEFLAGITSDGTLLAPGAQPAIDTRRMVRPYLAVTFSTEIVDTAKGVFTSARSAGRE